ncbi:MAG: hypothetical protein R2789_11460 [Microthrixaceae bacterium]
MIPFMFLAAEEGEHIAENAFWLPHDIKEVFWGTLAFLIVMGLLWKFAKASAATSSRSAPRRSRRAFDAAAAARAEAEAERDRIKAALADST